MALRSKRAESSRVLGLIQLILGRLHFICTYKCLHLFKTAESFPQNLTSLRKNVW